MAITSKGTTATVPEATTDIPAGAINEYWFIGLAIFHNPIISNDKGDGTVMPDEAFTTTETHGAELVRMGLARSPKPEELERIAAFYATPSEDAEGAEAPPARTGHVPHAAKPLRRKGG